MAGYRTTTESIRLASLAGPALARAIAPQDRNTSGSGLRLGGDGRQALMAPDQAGGHDGSDTPSPPDQREERLSVDIVRHQVTQGVQAGFSHLGKRQPPGDQAQAPDVRHPAQQRPAERVALEDTVPGRAQYLIPPAALPFDAAWSVDPPGLACREQGLAPEALHPAVMDFVPGHRRRIESHGDAVRTS